MRKMIFVPVLVLLMLFAVAPAFAFPPKNPNTKKIEFTYTVYIVAYSPPTRTWYSANNQIIHTTGSVTTLMSADGLLTVVSNGDHYQFNFVTGKGHSLEKWIGTYAEGSPIGEGTIEGTRIGETEVSNNYVGTGFVVGHGSSDLYSHIIELATCSWQPVITPYGETIALTTTGVYIVQE
jgi:hypothetical protein